MRSKAVCIACVINGAEASVVGHERAVEQVFAEREGVIAPLILQKVPDMGAGAGGDDPIKPRGAGPAGR